MLNGLTQATATSPELSGYSVPITEHSPWPLVMLEGPDYIVRSVNPAFGRLLNQDAEAFLGKPFREVMPEKDECFAVLDRVFHTGKPENHTQEEASSTHIVFWSYSMWPVMGKAGPMGVMLHVMESARIHQSAVAMNEALVVGALRQHELADEARDLNEKLRSEIEERTWAEDALRASEERFRVLFNLGPVAIFSCDRKGAIQNYNLRAAELWGRHPKCGDDGEHFSGPLKLYRKDGQLLPHAESPILQVLNGATFTREEDVFILRPDGSRIAAAVTFVPLKNGQGEITGAITAFYDISARRHLEESLAARAADLVEADRSKDEFLAMLAHELRNPLAPLRNAAEILLSPDTSTDARDQAQHILVRQIENMSRMIDDLLDVARITEGKVELRRSVAPLAPIIAGASILAQPGIQARHQKLTVTIPPGRILLNADATRLEQIFGNLLINASKYSGAKSQISLSAEIVSETGNKTPEVIVRIKDDGIGIAPELLPHVFDLFVQATSALDRSAGGLGIGLTLVQRLVKMHGGSVEARSEGLGQGSEFLVRLPILPPEIPVARPGRRALSSGREIPRRILVVDDNEDSARSMCMLQHLSGHETQVAFSGPEALEIVEEFAPDVVILDIGLPGMDGFEVARRMRAMPALKNIFLIAMTGYGNPEDRTTAAEAGFDEYLLKPVDLDLLRETLRELTLHKNALSRGSNSPAAAA